MAKVRALMSGAGSTPVLESLYATENGDYTPSQGVDGYDQVTVAVPEPVIITKNIVLNGTYNAIDDNASGYSSVFVNVPTGAVGVIVGSDDPVSSQGVDGDYYYKRTPALKHVTSGWNYQNSSSASVGMSFTVPSAVRITGLRVYNRTNSATLGTIQFGTNSVIYNSGVIPIPAGWYEHRLPTPIDLTPGVTYTIIIAYNNSGYASYTPLTLLSSDVINITSGRYGSFPGNIDSSNAYAVDVMIDDPDTLEVIGQYKKVSGVWTPITI